MVDFHSLRLSTNWEHVKYWSSVFFCMQNSICHMFCVPFYILLFLFNCLKFPALKRFRFLTQMFVSCIWRPSEETRISNLPPGFFRIKFSRFLSSGQVSSEPISNFFSIFIQLPIIRIKISRRRLLPGELLLPKIILALCKTRKDFQKLILTIFQPFLPL